MLSFGGGGMFRTYSSDDAPGIPMSVKNHLFILYIFIHISFIYLLYLLFSGPKGVAFLSLGFLGVVIILHVIGKLF